jgi:hypothetical protein
MIDANKKARAEDGIPVATAGTAPPSADNLAPPALEGFIQDDVSGPVSTLRSSCYSGQIPSAIIVAGDGTDSNVSMRRVRIGHISGDTAAVWVETKADQDGIYKMMMAKSNDSGPQRVYCRVTEEKNWPTHPYGVTLNMGLQRKKAPVSAIVR